MKYGKLTVIKDVEKHIYPSGIKTRKVLCKCDCGKNVEVIFKSLKSGNTNSCGCIRKKMLKNRAIHGYRNHKLYPVWVALKARCYNKNNYAYKDYGSRGIIVCPEWKNILA